MPRLAEESCALKIRLSFYGEENSNGNHRAIGACKHQRRNSSAQNPQSNLGRPAPLPALDFLQPPRQKHSAQSGNGLSPRPINTGLRSSTQSSGEGSSRRAASCACASRLRAHTHPAARRRKRLHRRPLQLHGRSRQSMGRNRSPAQRPWEHRACQRCRQHRRRTRRLLSHHRCHLHGHRAVMRSMPPAAGGQTRVVARFERPRQGPQPEKQNQRT